MASTRSCLFIAWRWVTGALLLLGGHAAGQDKVSDTAASQAALGVPEESVPTTGELAERLRDAYAGLKHLSFEVVVTQEGIDEKGNYHPPREGAWAKVKMSGEKNRLDVYRCQGGEHLITLIDDGEQITEITRSARLQYPATEQNKGNLHLDDSVGFDGCRVGGLLSSWLSSYPRRTPLWTAQRVREGRYVTLETVEGRPCYVVTSRVGEPGPERVVTDFAFYIDTKDFLLRKRVGYQRAFDSAGATFHIVSRISQYRSISTEPIDPAAFVVGDEAQPSQGADPSGACRGP